MTINDISLTAGMRANLASLQGTVALLNRTQQRLSTGRKVNSALDDPVNFFTAQALNARASDLSAYKDGMSNAVQTIEAANQGITTLTSLIASAKGVASSAIGTTGAERTALLAQYTAIIGQMDDVVADSSFKGINLLDASADLTVDFGGGHSLTVTSADVTSASGLSLVAAGTAAWAADADVTTDIGLLDAATTTLRSTSSTLSSNLTIINARQDFSSNLINILQTGADNLTLADTNQEGANMLMLQTRQSLGTTALSLSSQAAQSVLRLFA